jgi:hypothetical protein
MARLARRTSIMHCPLRLLIASLLAAALFAADDPAVFKSDVAMTRVDVQVVDQMGRVITGLQAKDFVLRVDGKAQPIRNFASENMPVDILLLLDVSGSMEPHVQRIADASEQALRVLSPQDRMAVMVFDTRTRVRLPFNQDHGEITGELHNILRAEGFNGGTRVTHALLDAAKYIGRAARQDARRAIVILTDDQTQDEEAGSQVQTALDEANAVLSFLRAPYQEQFVRGGGRAPGSGGGPWGGSNWPGGGQGPGGGGSNWPGGGQGPWGGSNWPGGGGRFPGGGRLPGGVTMGGDPSHPAGTADVAKNSGGDVMQISDASAFEDTLERIRRRYALHFYWPQGATNPEGRTVVVSLAHSTGARYQGAEVRYRRAYFASGVRRSAGGMVEISREADPADPEEVQPKKDVQPKTADAIVSAQPPVKRRVAVNERSGPLVNSVDVEAADSSQPSTSTPEQTPDTTPAKRGGWPRVDEGKSRSSGDGPIFR